jgi:tetratricopeptide (TPR) repeat protein
MVTESGEMELHEFRAIKVGVVGNSNSILRGSYVEALSQTPGIVVTNRSIGASPNVILLDFLGRETDLDYDFIIIETAVVDFLQRFGPNTMQRSMETLELFIGYVQAVSNVQIIILTIPTRGGLMESEAHWQESLYRNTAARFGLPILDGFRLIRQLIGPTAMNSAGVFMARALKLAAAFDLPDGLALSIAWRELRDRNVATNALGIFAFADHAHLSDPLHALIGSILAEFMISTGPTQDKPAPRMVRPDPPLVLAVDPTGGNNVTRTSTLLSRELVALDAADRALYQCPPGYRAFGLLLNASKTVCFLQLQSPGGQTEFDTRFARQPFDWAGIIVPVIDYVGDGIVEVTLLDAPPEGWVGRPLEGAGIWSGPLSAEIGELIVVRQDWRDRVRLPPEGNATAFHLEDTTWAKWAVEEAATRAARIARGIEFDGQFVQAACVKFASALLARGNAPLSFADQARLLLVLGAVNQLPGFFASVQQPKDKELAKMYSAVRKLLLGESASDAPFDMKSTPPENSHVDDRDQEMPQAPQLMESVKTMEPETISRSAKAAMDAAAAALGAGDIASAQSLWREARSAPDAPYLAWVFAAEQPGTIDPVELLEAAYLLFPHEPRVLHDLARAHEKRKNWPAASTFWQRYIARGGNRLWWAHAALAAALQMQGRSGEAEAALRDGVSQLPDEPPMLAETARFAQARGDFSEALQTWDLIIEKFPHQWDGYRGKAQMLSQSGRAQEANDLIDTYAPSLPNDLGALHDLARLAERQRDWQRAEPLWRSFLALHSGSVWAHLALACTLREQARYAEAENVLREARKLFPQDTDLTMEAARCARLRGDLTEAAEQWRAVGKSWPASPAGPLGEADALRQDGQIEAADEVILAAIKRLPDEPSLLEAYGLNAMAQEAWTEALTRLETAQRRFPSSDPLRQRIFEVRLKITEEGGAPPAAPSEDESGAEDRALLMQFESLGGGGHGCEFGIFQRYCGAEPLGLLRWADVYQEHLSIALETEFAGIGDPEFTNIFVPDNSEEYWTTDSRYHMAMRSFVSVADVPLDRMRQQVTKRMKYLSRKLADDLRAGTKIFVYKNMKRNLTDAELQRLHVACRRYGDNTLLYIRYEDAEHPCGTVVVAGDGLLIGYIDHFSHTPDTDVYMEAATDAFLRICRNAHALWQQAISGGDAKLPPLAERLATAEAAARKGSVDTVRALLPGIISELGGDLKGLLPIASAFMSRAEFGEAETVLTKMHAAMPDYFPAFEAFGMSAFHQRDWPLTISRWREIHAAFPDHPRPAVWLAAALQATRRFDEGEEILHLASERFPGDLEIARDYARQPLSFGQVEEAVTRLATLRERFPTSVDGFAIGAEALRSLGRLDEAEMLLESVRSQFEDNFSYNFQSARNATCLGRWEDAFKRWAVLLERWPDDQNVNTAVGDTITLWSLARAEGDPAALHAELPDEIARRAGAAMDGDPSEPGTPSSYRELFMAFEGLGDRCEFGLAQRHFGAEPLSLLRWSGIEPHQLIAVLESRFDGVGDPENTFVRLNENSNEYFAGDNRYFYTHTFIKKNEGDETELFEKIHRRVAYLARQLLADLEEGTKIFVYKNNAGDLTDADADAIIGAFTRHYPTTRLVLMRVARDPSQIGTVEPLAGNVVWAFLSRFNENLESRFIRYDEWRDALGAAMKHFATRS